MQHKAWNVGIGQFKWFSRSAVLNIRAGVCAEEDHKLELYEFSGVRILVYNRTPKTGNIFNEKSAL